MNKIASIEGDRRVEGESKGNLTNPYSAMFERTGVSRTGRSGVNYPLNTFIRH